MNRLVLALTGSLLAGAAVMGLSTQTDASPAATAPAMADAFTVDAVHSSVVFRVKHQNVAFFYGRFNKVSGSFNLDEANPAASSLDITIDAESVDTANEGRDKHLRRLLLRQGVPRRHLQEHLRRKQGREAVPRQGRSHLPRRHQARRSHRLRHRPRLRPWRHEGRRL